LHSSRIHSPLSVARLRGAAVSLASLLALLLTSCDNGRGKLRLEGEFRNLDQAEFLVYSPDGAFPGLDTLRLAKGRFQHQITLQGGPFTFTIIYPNFHTLSFRASEGDKVQIAGDALALADVKVKGASPLGEQQPPKAPFKVGSRLPKVKVIEQSRRPGKHLLVAFWANWKGGTSIVNQNIRKALADSGDRLTALSYSLDVDPSMRQAGEALYNPNWDTYCDYLAWDSPAVRRLGINRLPYLILLNPKGIVIAAGSDYARDIQPSIPKP